MKPKIEVGRYYQLQLHNGHKIVFGVMYGFDSGKNKDVYALMIYSEKRCFEFPIHKNLFKQWSDKKMVREITWDETLNNVMGLIT